MIKKNRIPKDFAEITIRSKIRTNVSTVGDILFVRKDRYGRYIARVDKTDKEAEISLTALRDSGKFEILNVVK